MSNAVVSETSNQTEPQVKTPDFGNGRYSSVMKEIYRDCKRELGLSSRKSEKVARTLGADLGRLNANPELKLGNKLGKDGTITVREVATMKGVTLTYALSIAKVLATLQELKKFGFESAKDITFSETITEWLEKE